MLNLREFHRKNIILSMLFGTSWRSTLIDMIREVKDFWTRCNLKLLLLRSWMKQQRDNWTMCSGTCSELILMQTKRSTSLNLYFSPYLGSFHFEPCWIDLIAEIPSWADKGQEQFEWRWTVHRVVKRLQIPFINAKEEISGWCYFQSYLQGQRRELRRIHEMDKQGFGSKIQEMMWDKLLWLMTFHFVGL